jgi:hypothetical protein
MWWIIALIALLVVCIVVLQRRGTGSGDPNYRPPEGRSDFPTFPGGAGGPG